MTFSEASIAWLFIPVVRARSFLMTFKIQQLKLSIYLQKKWESKYTKRTATGKILYHSDWGELLF